LYFFVAISGRAVLRVSVLIGILSNSSAHDWSCTCIQKQYFSVRRPAMADVGFELEIIPSELVDMVAALVCVDAS
jgi:hypothetical protein